MGISDVWDYFMRRKLLILVILLVSILAGVLSSKLCFGRIENEVSLEVPKTGEVEAESGRCEINLEILSKMELGNGSNNPEENEAGSGNMTFEEPTFPAPQPIDSSDNSEVGAKIESIIITTGVTAALGVIVLGKFLFDHYVR